MAKKETIKPVVIRIANDNGNEDVYTLEFDRASVVWAETHGLKINEAESSPMNTMASLFHFAFRKHHPMMTRQQTDKILFDEEYGLGGFGDQANAVFERLTQLYTLPFNAMSGDSKNSKATVEL